MPQPAAEAWATFVLAENHPYIKLLSRFVVVVLLKREAWGGGGSERDRERERERGQVLCPLNQLLMRFVLAENHSYIKLLTRFVVEVLFKRGSRERGGGGGSEKEREGGRAGLMSLNQLLMHWASFLLAENHSYIKLLSRLLVEEKEKEGGGGGRERPLVGEEGGKRETTSW